MNIMNDAPNVDICSLKHRKKLSVHFPKYLSLCYVICVWRSALKINLLPFGVNLSTKGSVSENL